MKEEYLSKTAHEIFIDLKDEPHNSTHIKTAVKMVKRCVVSSETGKLDEGSGRKSSYRVEGGGRHVKIPEIRHTLLEYFDIRIKLNRYFQIVEI